MANAEEMPPESIEASAEAVIEQEHYAKQSLNIYTVMLLIALVCLIVAIIALAVNLSRWGSIFPYTTDSMAPPASMLLHDLSQWLR